MTEIALKKMEAFSIIEKLPATNDEGKPNPIRLTPVFYDGIRIAISSLSSAPWQAATPVTKDQKNSQQQPNNSNNNNPTPPTSADLELFTQKRWESVLHYLVGSTDSSHEEPPAGVKTFLETTGLMQDDPDYVPPSSNKRSSKGGDKNADANTNKPPLIITSKGYEFMLQDKHMQVWQFVLQLLLSFFKKNVADYHNEAILFLVALSYCKVGEGYPKSALSKTHQQLYKFFKQLGLVYTCKLLIQGSKNKDVSTVIYPTRVAVSLVSGGSQQQQNKSESKDRNNPSNNNTSESSSSLSSKLKFVENVLPATTTSVLESQLSSPVPSTSHIAIIVQTNFQLFAYTSSTLHVAMLGLFCDISNYKQLPNVIIYRITRDSVKEAFRLGIKAHQILRFLKMHAHPRLRTSGQSTVPPNVEDQILLWDKERNRVVFDEVHTHQCTTKDEFEYCQMIAKNKGAYAWGSELTHKIMLKYEKAEIVLEYLRDWKMQVQRKRAKSAQEGAVKRRRKGSY